MVKDPKPQQLSNFKHLSAKLVVKKSEIGEVIFYGYKKSGFQTCGMCDTKNENGKQLMRCPDAWVHSQLYEEYVHEI